MHSRGYCQSDCKIPDSSPHAYRQRPIFLSTEPPTHYSHTHTHTHPSPPHTAGSCNVNKMQTYRSPTFITKIKSFQAWLALRVLAAFSFLISSSSLVLVLAKTTCHSCEIALVCITNASFKISRLFSAPRARGGAITGTRSLIPRSRRATKAKGSCKVDRSFRPSSFFATGCRFCISVYWLHPDIQEVKCNRA